MPRSYVAGTVTDIAPVAAIPTTAAHFSLWNGEPDGGKSYTITTAAIVTTTSAGAVIVLQLLAHLSVAKLPIITGTAASAIRSTDGMPTATRANVASAVTITAANGVWHPVGQSIVCAGTANIGLGTWTNVRGLYTVPPGGIFSLAGLCSAAGSAKCQLYVQWEEN